MQLNIVYNDKKMVAKKGYYLEEYVDFYFLFNILNLKLCNQLYYYIY